MLGSSAACLRPLGEMPIRCSFGERPSRGTRWVGGHVWEPVRDHRRGSRGRRRSALPALSRVRSIALARRCLKPPAPRGMSTVHHEEDQGADALTPAASRGRSTGLAAPIRSASVAESGFRPGAWALIGWRGLERTFPGKRPDMTSRGTACAADILGRAVTLARGIPGGEQGIRALQRVSHPSAGAVPRGVSVFSCAAR